MPVRNDSNLQFETVLKQRVSVHGYVTKYGSARTIQTSASHGNHREHGTEHVRSNQQGHHGHAETDRQCDLRSRQNRGHSAKRAIAPRPRKKQCQRVGNEQRLSRHHGKQVCILLHAKAGEEDQVQRVPHERKGAASRVPVAATAFGLRRDHVLLEIVASCPDLPDRSEERRHQRWVRDTRRAFDPIALPGGYPNLLGSDGVDRAAESFGTNVERLARVKQLYDPENVFCSAIPLPIGRHLRTGYLVRGSTLAELAKAIGVDAAALQTTVAEFNRHARNGEDPAFGKGILQANRFFVLKPEQTKYTTQLAQLPDDPEKFQEIYVFLPSLRRSLRLSSAARCSPILGTDWVQDDNGDGLFFQVPNFSVKLLGEKKVLQTYNGDPKGYYVSNNFDRKSWPGSSA